MLNNKTTIKLRFLIDKLIDFILPNFIFIRLVNSFHRKISRSILAGLKRTGSNIQLHRNIILHNPERVEIGDDVSIGDRVIIMAFGGVNIGNRVMIGHDVSIITVTHNHSNHIMINEMLHSPVEIADDVWIGAKTIIMPGVTLGNGVVIGAGSIVTRSIPANAIAFGAPAEVVIKDRFSHPLKNSFQSFKYQYSTKNCDDTSTVE